MRYPHIISTHFIVKSHNISVYDVYRTRNALYKTFCRMQMALVESIEAQMDAMMKVVEKY